jgi:hypothetical protein
MVWGDLGFQKVKYMYMNFYYYFISGKKVYTKKKKPALVEENVIR